LPSPHYIFCLIPTDSGNFQLYLTPPGPLAPGRGLLDVAGCPPPSRLGEGFLVLGVSPWP
jgi:hypothetical protein